jgi:hypothetical protein
LLVVVALTLAACTAQTDGDVSTTASIETTDIRSDFPVTGPVEAGTYHIAARHGTAPRGH